MEHEQSDVVVATPAPSISCSVQTSVSFTTISAL